MISAAIAALVIMQGIVMISCGSGDDRYATCGEVTYISEFPTEVTLDEPTPWMTDMMGTVSVKGIDTLMIGITPEEKHSMSLYSTVSGKKLADIFPYGQGPGEYSGWPSLKRLKMVNDSIYGVFKFSDCLFTLNLTATSEAGREICTDRCYPAKMDMMRDLLPLDNGDTLVIYRKDYGTGGFDRAIRNIEGEKMLSSLGTVSDEWKNVDSNTLGILPNYLANDSLIAEAMIQLNQIVVYSPYDERIRKTICVGDKQTPVFEDNFIDRRKRLRAYGGAQILNDKLALLYHGLGEWDYQFNNGASELQIFDSEVNPVARLKFPCIIEGFFIDNSGHLFGFTHLGDTETVYKWDISKYI